MVCIYCGNPTKVTNSRKTVRANQTWRRRQCTACHSTFTTNETVDFSRTYSVRTKDGTLTVFLPEKLLLSIYDSLGHRPNPLEDANAIYHTVMTRIVRSQNKANSPAVVERSMIIRSALSVLRRFDTAAATYYAAHHPESQ